MQLFFEEDGAHKTGLILRHEGNAYQVELSTGKRSKVKGGHVLFEFDYAGDFLKDAREKAAEIDPMFLWEVVSGREIDYTTLAQEYFTAPSVVERAATFFALHENPVYFYKKGRGIFKPAPQETLERALQAIERRKKEEEKKKAMTSLMLKGSVPEEIRAQALTLLLKPDKNSIEWKALNDASSAMHITPLKCLLKLGAIRSPYQWHTEAFYFENFPQGRGFSRSLPSVPEQTTEHLPQASVKAFSIDDSQTTEIDDATSVTKWGVGKLRIGIHIAAPSLLIERDSALDKVARERLSTVYGPGIKTTMLPENWISAASLDAGKSKPCVSLYAIVDEESMAVLSTETLVEHVHISDNLRYDTFEDLVTEEALQNGTLTMDYADEMTKLWRFAKARKAVREQVRGRPEMPMRKEWYFVLEGQGESARATLKSRTRGAPIDLIVSELMIFANETWGLWLEEHGFAGIYRSQRLGRVKMGITPGPHDGLGVMCYAWSTSPLRRYVDLVNQRQILCAALGRSPAYEAKDTDLYTTVSAFESAYEAYNDFQRRMERYWSLRWIEQEKKTEVIASVVKDELVRIEGLPMMQRIPGLPELERGQRIRLQILGCDYLELVLETRLIELLDVVGEDFEEQVFSEEISESPVTEQESEKKSSEKEDQTV